jgi:hypothetical protein
VPFAKREVWPAPKLDDSGAARVSLTPPSPGAEERGIAGGVDSASRARGPRRPSRIGFLVGLSAVAVVGALLVLGVGRQRQIAVSHAADAPTPKPSLASSDQFPAPARPALTSNVASTPAAPPPALPLGGAGGSAVAHSVRRHAARPAPVSAASSTPPAAPDAKPLVAPVTFDRQNPYE